MSKHLTFQAQYDPRFMAMLIQIKLGEEIGPVHHIRISDILRGLQPHELRAVLDEIKVPYTPEPNIEEVRRQVIRDTDLKGKMVLDLSGYDGAMARVALESGAAKALVVDSEQWRIYGWKQPAPIPGVEFIKSDLYDWKEPADVVIWYNCLYHVRDPLRALAHVRSLTKETMLLCALHRYHDGPWMYVYLPRECNPTDPSVYFGPSISALERMLSLTGWKYKQEGIALDRCVYRCWPIPDFVDAETEEVRRVSTIL